MHTGIHTQALKIKQQNRTIARKKWAVRENFSDIIHFLKELGDENIFYHLQQASARASYISATSTDEFLKCLNDHLENGF